PVCAPWMRAAEGIDFARAVGAPRNLAIHDRIYSEAGLRIVDGQYGLLLPETSAYHRLADGADLGRGRDAPAKPRPHDRKERRRPLAGTETPPAPFVTDTAAPRPGRPWRRRSRPPPTSPRRSPGGPRWYRPSSPTSSRGRRRPCRRRSRGRAAAGPGFRGRT